MQENESAGVCVAGQGGKRGLRGQKREQWTALSRDPCYEKTAVFNSVRGVVRANPERLTSG